VTGSVSTDWTIVGAADFSDDGTIDLIWRDRRTGGYSVWQTSGSGFTQNVTAGTVSSTWRVAGSADFTGDGKADLL
jgi:hypothetical protein